MASFRSKQVEVKLTVDGSTIRLRFVCKGQLSTKSFSPTANELSVNIRAAQWLSEQFDDQLVKLQEAADGSTR